jgi:hypothetical protein
MQRTIEMMVQEAVARRDGETVTERAIGVGRERLEAGMPRRDRALGVRMQSVAARVAVRRRLERRPHDRHEEREEEPEDRALAGAGLGLTTQHAAR